MDVLTDRKISKKEYIAYFSYGFGQCLSFGLIGTFILFFYTDILKISAVTASLIFLVARIWDAVIDPVVAGLMDMRRTKVGKFRGYMKFIPIFIVISTILCFVAPDISNMGKVLYATATYMLWGTVYAFSDIPFWSLSTVISNNPQDRTKLLTTANLGVYIGIGMASIQLPILVSWIQGSESPSTSYLFAVSVIMLVAFLCMMFGYRFTKERIEPTDMEKVVAKDLLAAVKANKYMFTILLIYFMNIFMNIVQGIINYFFIYNMANPNLMSLFGLLGSVAILGFLFIPLLTRHFKKKNILIALLSVEIICRFIFYAVGFSSVSFVLTMLCVTILLSSMVGPLVSTMLAETVEYSEVKTGKRCEAIVFGGQTFAGKLSIALAGALTGVILALIGYQPDAVQAVSTLNGIFFSISLLPAVGCVIRILLLIPYKFTEKEYGECLVILENRKIEKNLNLGEGEIV